MFRMNADAAFYEDRKFFMFPFFLPPPPTSVDFNSKLVLYEQKKNLHGTAVYNYDPKEL